LIETTATTGGKKCAERSFKETFVRGCVITPKHAHRANSLLTCLNITSVHRRTTASEKRHAAASPYVRHGAVHACAWFSLTRRRKIISCPSLLLLLIHHSRHAVVHCSSTRLTRKYVAAKYDGRMTQKACPVFPDSDFCTIRKRHSQRLRKTATHGCSQVGVWYDPFIPIRHASPIMTKEFMLKIIIF